MSITRPYRIVFGAVFLLWAAACSFLFRDIRLGLDFWPGTKVSASVVEAYADGKEIEHPAVPAGNDGKMTFSIDRCCRSFFFRFHLEPGFGQTTFRFVRFRLLGFPALNASQVARFNMRQKLYTEVPENDGGVLSMTLKDGDVFELPNVFPFLCHVVRMFTLLLAWGPISLFLLWLAVRNLGRPAAVLLDKVIGNRFLFLGIAVVAVIFSLPPLVTPVRTGLDPSWIWMINHYAFSGCVGERFVFTYGPLGFLFFPQESFANMICGIPVAVFMAGMLFWMITVLYRGRGMNASGSTLLFLLFLWILGWPNGVEWKWCVVSVMAGVLACFSQVARFERYALFGLAALTAVLLSFVKFSSCVSVVGQQLFLLGMYAMRERRASVKGICVYGAVFAVFSALGTVTLFPSWNGLVLWIKGSMEMSTGYNLYMGGARPFVELAGTFCVLIVLAAGVLLNNRDRVKGFLYWFALSPLLFCTYKYALVRQSAIPLCLVVAWFSGLQMVISDCRKKAVMVVAVTAVVIACFTEIVWLGRTPGVVLSVSNLLTMCRPREALAKATAASAEDIRRAAVPSAWKERIGTNKVMIAGMEMGPAMEGGMNLVPFPAVQTYSAYTPYLDELCARHLTDVAFLLVPANPLTFDSRNVYFDNPRLWAEVRRLFVYVDSNADHVLLERRHVPAVRQESGEKFRIRRTVPGKLVSMFYRTPQTMARIRLKSGKEVVCAANVEVLDGAPVPEFLPVDTPTVVSYFKGDTAGNVRSISFLPCFGVNAVTGNVSE